MRDSHWNILSENSAKFEEFVANVIYVVGRQIDHAIGVDDEIRDMLVMIAIGLNGCLDGGNFAKMNQDIVDHFLGEDDEDEIDENE
jgi:hypothetical protein